MRARRRSLKFIAALVLLCLTEWVAVVGHSLVQSPAGASASSEGASSRTASRQDAPPTTRSRELITLNAVTVAEANPSISFRFGDIPAAYAKRPGLQEVAEQGLGQSLALAAGDFDEDGMPDLITGHAGPAGGVLALHRGNVESVYQVNGQVRRAEPASQVDSPSPFHLTARVFDVPVPPQLIGTGDFDSDGHQDVVIAAIGDQSLYLSIACASSSTIRLSR